MHKKLKRLLGKSSKGADAPAPEAETGESMSAARSQLLPASLSSPAATPSLDTAASDVDADIDEDVDAGVDTGAAAWAADLDQDEDVEEAGPKKRSKTSLRAEKAGIYAKKFGARALDTAMFAPLHMIDQLSILDVHAVDAANFMASGKTRRQRQKAEENDKFTYKGMGKNDFVRTSQMTEKGRKGHHLRELGRTGLRDYASEGVHVQSSVANLSNKGPQWQWGAGDREHNPVRNLRRAGMSRAAAPGTKDNMRLTEIKDEMAARKKAKKAGKGA